MTAAVGVVVVAGVGAAASAEDGGGSGSLWKIENPSGRFCRGEGRSQNVLQQPPRHSASGLCTGAKEKRRRMFLREKEEMSSAVNGRCYDNIWSPRG